MAADQDDLPPKTVKAQLVRLDDNLKRIERAQFAGIQRAPGSLPVLEAFQEFLEHERKIAQRRLLIVTGASVVAIAISLIASGLYIRHALGKANLQTEALAQTTQELQDNLGSLTEKQTTTEEALTATRQALSDQQQALDTQSSQLQTVSTTREASDRQVIQLREQMEALLTDQKNIQRMLEGYNMNPRQMSGNRQPTANVAQTQPDTLVNNTIGPGRRREEVPPEQIAHTVQYATITLSTEGRSGVRWILPIASALE